jgi:hypothetical protein
MYFEEMVLGSRCSRMAMNLERLANETADLQVRLFPAVFGRF